MIGRGWTVRVIGILNTFILARLLTPEDFGLFAMAAMSMTLIDQFSSPGVGLHLIRKKGVNSEDLDTAWSIALLQKLLLASILYTTAPLGAAYFKEPQVEEIMHWLALSAFIMGFKNNVGMAAFLKELRFSRSFLFSVYNRGFLFVVAVPIAYALQSYWALVINNILGALIEVILSYRMHDYRPHFSLSRWRSFVGFSATIAGIKTAQSLSQRLDLLVVARLGGDLQAGLYSVSGGASRMVTSEIIGPVGAALLPNYAKLAHDRTALQTAFSNSISVIAALAIPIGAGVSVLSEGFVHVLLGGQWDEAGSLVRWLALYALGDGLIRAMSVQILIVSYKERVYLLLVWVRLTMLALVIWAATTGFGGTQGIAPGAAIFTWGFLPVACFVAAR